LTHADVLDSWRVHGELNGHSPSQTIQFVGDLMDVADAQAQRRALSVAVILAGASEPRWVTRLRARFGDGA
jgi:hypothetical protein